MYTNGNTVILTARVISAGKNIGAKNETSMFSSNAVFRYTFILLFLIYMHATYADHFFYSNNILNLGICLVPWAKLTASFELSVIHDSTKSPSQAARKQLSTKEPKKPCDEDKLMLYLAEIQIINPENIISLSTLDDLAAVCKKLSKNLDTMSAYLKTCDPPNQHDLYIELIKGVNSLYQKLCHENAFSKEFKQQHQCFHSLHDDFEDCAGPADWNEDEETADVCKAYKSIINCYYVKTAKLCGKHAAAVMKELIVAVINSVLVIRCHHIHHNPYVPDAMPDLSTENEPHWIVVIYSFLSLYIL